MNNNFLTVLQNKFSVKQVHNCLKASLILFTSINTVTTQYQQNNPSAVSKESVSNITGKNNKSRCPSTLRCLSPGDAKGIIACKVNVWSLVMEFYEWVDSICNFIVSFVMETRYRNNIYISKLLSHEIFLTVPSGTTTTYGDRAFTTVASTVWNRLPPTIWLCDSSNSFKTLLKTHLFHKVYVQVHLFLNLLYSVRWLWNECSPHYHYFSSGAVFIFHWICHFLKFCLYVFSASD